MYNLDVSEVSITPRNMRARPYFKTADMQQQLNCLHADARGAVDTTHHGHCKPTDYHVMIKHANLQLLYNMPKRYLHGNPSSFV